MRHTLVINRFDSRCGNCGANVNPHSATCDPIGYEPIPPSCGERYVFVTSDYRGMHVEALRPDLEVSS